MQCHNTNQLSNPNHQIHQISTTANPNPNTIRPIPIAKSSNPNTAKYGASKSGHVDVFQYKSKTSSKCNTNSNTNQPNFGRQYQIRHEFDVEYGRLRSRQDGSVGFRLSRRSVDVGSGQYTNLSQYNTNTNTIQYVTLSPNTVTKFVVDVTGHGWCRSNSGSKSKYNHQINTNSNTILPINPNFDNTIQIQIQIPIAKIKCPANSISSLSNTKLQIKSKSK